jgi:hypothetical protein
MDASTIPASRRVARSMPVSDATGTSQPLAPGSEASCLRYMPSVAASTPLPAKCVAKHT